MHLALQCKSLHQPSPSGASTRWTALCQAHPRAKRLGLSSQNRVPLGPSPPALRVLAPSPVELTVWSVSGGRTIVFSIVFITSFHSSFSTRFRTVFSQILAKRVRLKKDAERGWKWAVEWSCCPPCSPGLQGRGYTHVGLSWPQRKQLIHISRSLGAGRAGLALRHQPYPS